MEPKIPFILRNQRSYPVLLSLTAMVRMTCTAATMMMIAVRTDIVGKTRS